MRYQDALDLIYKNSATSSSLALIRKDEFTELIIISKDIESRLRFQESKIEKRILDFDGNCLFSGTWNITRNTEFKTEETSAYVMLLLESHSYPPLTIMLPRSERKEEIIEVYTDGSCRMKEKERRGHGAWAYVLVKDGMQLSSAFNYVEDASTLDMELMAITHGIKAARKRNPEKIAIYTDSAIIIKTIEKKLPVIPDQHNAFSKDVWTKFKNIVNSNSIPLSWTWVKGHSGNYWHEEANRLAQSITLKKKTQKK